MAPTITPTPALASALVAVVTGIAGAYRYYKRTGTIPATKLPLNAIRKLFYALRVSLFTRGKPPATETLKDSIGEVRTSMAVHSYEPKWPFSFHYYGEDANLRRYYYDDSRRYPHRQVHTRLWDRGDGTTDEYTHEEPSPLHHPIAHIRSKDMTSVTEALKQAYDGEGGRSLTLDPQTLVPDKKK